MALIEWKFTKLGLEINDKSAKGLNAFWEFAQILEAISCVLIGKKERTPKKQFSAGDVLVIVPMGEKIGRIVFRATPGFNTFTTPEIIAPRTAKPPPLKKPFEYIKVFQEPVLAGWQVELHILSFAEFLDAVPGTS